MNLSISKLKDLFIILGIIGGVVTTGLIIFFINRYCRGHIPFYLCDPQRAQRKQYGELLIEDDIKNERREIDNAEPINSDINSSKLAM